MDLCRGVDRRSLGHPAGGPAGSPNHRARHRQVDRRRCRRRADWFFVAVILRHLVRNHKTSLTNAVWLITSAALVVATAATSETPIEGLHFVQYGVLGALAFRALSHRMEDAGIFFGAAVIAGIVGTIDEAIQWLLPNRFWDVRDIALIFQARYSARSLSRRFFDRHRLRLDCLLRVPSCCHSSR